jgi:predicted nucleic acid-binding protein
MNGNDTVVIDTNSLIYFFNGNEKVIKAIDGQTLYVAAITEIELLSFSKPDIESEQQI